ncbi:MAG TPA: hypothetical protein PK819_08235, partial [Thermomicrobiales bacterium]|nr:hypothetical protein [Thermomicrobiales bacterium]
MTTIVGSALLILQLPPPPGTDAGNGGSEWWRILAVLIVTVLTVGLFAWIFKPTPATGPHVAPPDPSPGMPEMGEQLHTGNLVPFRERTGTPSISETDFTTAAATERLRRLTSREQPPGTLPQERRRLGGKRPPGPNPPPTSDTAMSSSAPTLPTTPSIQPVEETTVEQNPSEITPTIDDFLDDLANQDDSEESKPYETMRGDALTERELQHLTPDVPAGSNILP